LLGSGGGALPVVQRTRNGGVLRRLARPLSGGDDVRLLESRLRASLAASERGVGLAAPQVGIGARAILVMLGAHTPAARVDLFLNPRVVERSDDTLLDYEGCLSVPDVCGLVRRSRRIVVEHGLAGTAAGRLEAGGFDARIFQHEIDHLDGVLFVDRVEGGLQPKERLRQLREELRREHPELALAMPGAQRHGDGVL
jgi:peptide deformylase